VNGDCRTSPMMGRASGSEKNYTGVDKKKCRAHEIFLGNACTGK
jgi:hypothetical protein